MLGILSSAQSTSGIALPTQTGRSQASNQGNGLSFMEKAAATAVGWPKRIFLPADLGNHLDGLQGDRRPDSVTVYKK